MHTYEYGYVSESTVEHSPSDIVCSIPSEATTKQRRLNHFPQALSQSSQRAPISSSSSSSSDDLHITDSMEMMTLLKWQLQQPRKNETKCYPSHSTVENNQNELDNTPILNNKTVRMHCVENEMNKMSYSLQNLSNLTPKTTEIDSNCVFTDSQQQENSQSLSRQYNVSLFPTVKMSTVKSDIETSMSFQHTNTDKVDIMNVKGSSVHHEANSTFPRFSHHSDQTKSNNYTMKTAYTISPQDLSKSFPPYHEYTRLSPDRKLISSSPTSSGCTLLSPPLSSLSSHSPSASTPTAPFRLFSMQPSALFPISFATTSSMSVSPTTPPRFIDRDGIPKQPSPTDLPLTPPSPLHPQSHHNPHLPLPSSPTIPLPPPLHHQPKEEIIDNSYFLSRKRRHSTAPIIVDPNIPFNTYLQNLTKTLQASARSKSTSSNAQSQSPSNSKRLSLNSNFISNQQEPDSSCPDTHDSHQTHDQHNEDGHNHYDNGEKAIQNNNAFSEYHVEKRINHKDMENINDEKNTDNEEGEYEESDDTFIKVDEEIDDKEKDIINDEDEFEQCNLPEETHATGGKHWRHSKTRSHRRDRRFKRHRNVSELYIPDGQEGTSFKEEGSEELDTRHPLSAPVYGGVSSPVGFPNPVSLYPHYQLHRETLEVKPHPLPHPEDIQHQQQLSRHPPRPHHHHLPTALTSLPWQPNRRSPPSLFQSQLVPPGSQFSPNHIFNKLFPSLGTSPPRYADLHAHGRASVARTTVPGTSHFFTSQLLGMGSLGMRRSSSDKPPPVKKYKCDVCQKAFSRSNTLVTHKRIHTGDKPFKCEICGRAFRQPGNLTRHRLTHTTHKPYVCHVCGKAFNRASNLNTHIRTHNSFRQFGCAVCPKTSFHHKADINGDRSFKCDICGRGFSHSTTLLAHRRTHA